MNVCGHTHVIIRKRGVINKMRDCVSCHSIRDKKRSRTTSLCPCCGPICKHCEEDGTHIVYLDKCAEGKVRFRSTYNPSTHIPPALKRIPSPPPSPPPPTTLSSSTPSSPDFFLFDCMTPNQEPPSPPSSSGLLS